VSFHFAAMFFLIDEQHGGVFEITRHKCTMRGASFEHKLELKGCAMRF
jgi:hypothetical protein